MGTGISHGNLRKELHKQAEEAFAEPPDLSGIVYGRQRVAKGPWGYRMVLFPSRKNGVTIALKNRVGIPLCLLLERDRNVFGYRFRAFEFPYPWGRSISTDFLIKYKNGNFLVCNIAPCQSNLSVEPQKDLDQLGHILNECDFDFKVIREQDLPHGTYLTNLHFLYQRANLKEWSQLECEQAIECYAALPDTPTLRDLYEKLKMIKLPPLIADYHIFHRRLEVDLTKPLDLETHVRLIS